MTTVIYHSADYDGIFCREIARHFLGEKDVRYIGWNFGDASIPMPNRGDLYYILDLPPTTPLGLRIEDGWLVRDNILFLKEQRQIQPIDRVDWSNIIWIDHHGTSIASHPKNIPGYRIDGVAACRLAFQWFSMCKAIGQSLHTSQKPSIDFPSRDVFVARQVNEPYAVQLAGEYDVWDKRDPNAELFQYALRCTPLTDGIWDELLVPKLLPNLVESMLSTGQIAQYFAEQMDADLVKRNSFRLNWEGLNFLCLNTGKFNSLTFRALDKPETGHDALLGFMWNGKVWTVSLYHAQHRTDIDLSIIAVKYGGGGHRGACGFTCQKLPWQN